MPAFFIFGFMTGDQISPSKAGQICKILHPFADEDCNEVYIVVEDPTTFDADENIYVSSLTELQKNVKQPASTPQIAVVKCELTVIADDLESYVKSWNR